MRIINRKMIYSSKRSGSRFDSEINRNKIGLSKRSQEEIIGFVLIIIVVAVVALVFLGIFLRQAPKINKSSDAESFLHSSMLFTTECRPDVSRNLYSLKESLIGCSGNEKCYEPDRLVCDVFKEDLKELIEKSFKTGDEAKYSGYEVEVWLMNDKIFEQKSSKARTGNMVGAKIIDKGNSFNVSLRLYTNY